MTAPAGLHCTLKTTIEDTVLNTWFERDRAHVCLSRKDRDGDAGTTIVEWWDEAVHDAIEDGFLDRRDLHASAFENAVSHKLLPDLKIDLTPMWPSLMMAYVRATPADERPSEQPDRLEWYGEAADDLIAGVMKDRQFNELSPRQIQAIAETLAGALYDAAVAAESAPKPISVAARGGAITIESDGERVIARGGADGTPHALPDGRTGVFTLSWRHEDGPEAGELQSSFASARGLRTSILSVLKAKADEIEDVVLAVREWKAFCDLESASDRLRKDGVGPEAAQSWQRAYDAARRARAAARIQPDGTPSPAPAM